MNRESFFTEMELINPKNFYKKVIGLMGQIRNNAIF